MLESIKLNPKLNITIEPLRTKKNIEYVFNILQKPKHTMEVEAFMKQSSLNTT